MEKLHLTVKKNIKNFSKLHNKTKFLKNINPVTYLKTSDGWIGILDFLIAGETHTKNTLKDFVYTYFDIEAYTKLQDMTNDTGELLRFT